MGKFNFLVFVLKRCYHYAQGRTLTLLRPWYCEATAQTTSQNVAMPCSADHRSTPTCSEGICDVVDGPRQGVLGDASNDETSESLKQAQNQALSQLSQAEEVSQQEKIVLKEQLDKILEGIESGVREKQALSEELDRLTQDYGNNERENQNLHQELERAKQDLADDRAGHRKKLESRIEALQDALRNTEAYCDRKVSLLDEEVKSLRAEIDGHNHALLLATKQIAARDLHLQLMNTCLDERDESVCS